MPLIKPPKIPKRWANVAPEAWPWWFRWYLKWLLVCLVFRAVGLVLFVVAMMFFMIEVHQNGGSVQDVLSGMWSGVWGGFGGDGSGLARWLEGA